jgi:hypothetical protein
MPTYVNNLRIKEIVPGDEDGTWGTSTNLNLELIADALGYATQESFSSDANATTTIADAAVDPARAMYFKVTSAGALTATRTLTIAPNTVSRVMFIENATTGSQSIDISQGSGANVTIETGKTRFVYLDGAGAGAAIVDVFAAINMGAIGSTALTVDNLTVNGNTITADTGALNLTPAAGSAIVLDGTINVDAGVVTGATSITSTDFVGNINGDLTGTLQTAAQANVTSLGTLTSLTVDNLTVNGNTITADTGALNLTPAAGSAIVLDGTINVDAGVVTGATSITSTDFVGNINGDLTGTLQTAAQANVTSLGTLTTLTVDDITINGNTISSAGASTLAITPTAGQVITLDGAVTVDAGVVAGITSLSIGGTVITGGVLDEDNLASDSNVALATQQSIKAYADDIVVSGGGLVRQVEETSGFTAVAGNWYPVDTSGGAFTMTFPATPAVGAVVGVIDANGTFATNNLTLDRNGSNVMRAAEDGVIDTDNWTTAWVYLDATNGWVPKGF